MGFALMTSMAGSAELLVYDTAPAAAKRAQEQCSARITGSVSELVRESGMVLVAIKPQFLEEILEELAGSWQEDKILASIVAGKSIAFWQDILGNDAQIARIMPNTPVQVREGMSTVCFSASLKEPEAICSLLRCGGRVIQIREAVMDAAMGVAGCGPAYVYMMIEALADAGVAGGLFRQQAYELAAQTVLGAAKMVLETGRHPAELKDAVCSPAGVTIRGVMALEQGGFRAAVEDAVRASMHFE